MSEKLWQDLDGLKVRAHTVAPESRGTLPEGMVQIATVKALRARFGGDDWRLSVNLALTCRIPGKYEVETSATWKNEYGVTVEVMT